MTKKFKRLFTMLLAVALVATCIPSMITRAEGDHELKTFEKDGYVYSTNDRFKDFNAAGVTCWKGHSLWDQMAEPFTTSIRFAYCDVDDCDESYGYGMCRKSSNNRADHYYNPTGDSCDRCGWSFKKASASAPHTHSYEWATLLEPTTERDGEEAYICSCGDVEMTQPLSAALYTLRLNEKAIKNAKAGATVVVDLKRFNSVPKWFVEKLVERDDVEITLKFTYNHDNYALNVPKTATIEDESIAWYGPLKLLSMFPQK